MRPRRCRKPGARILLLAAAIALSCEPGSGSRPALADAARRAAEATAVPPELLLAIAHTESRGHSRVWEPGTSGWVRLSRSRSQRSAERAAPLLGTDTATVRAEPEVGMQAVAALVAQASREARVPDDDPAASVSWERALARFNGGRDPVANAFYAEEVLWWMTRGFAGHDDASRPFAVAGSEAWRPTSRPSGPRPADLVGAGFSDFWPANPRSHRPIEATGRAVRHIVIHATEGSFSTIFEYFRREGTRVGAHYLVRASDGLPVQMIDERAVAFHDACFNETSIGIEHEGYSGVGERWFGDALYRSSARLVRDIAARHGIPLDRDHIVGHDEAPDCSDHTDPGAAWDWDRFMTYVLAPD
jgi:hypothetical protein